jgi:hypothetical protein
MGLERYFAIPLDVLTVGRGTFRPERLSPNTNNALTDRMQGGAILTLSVPFGDPIEKSMDEKMVTVTDRTIIIVEWATPSQESEAISIARIGAMIEIVR